MIRHPNVELCRQSGTPEMLAHAIALDDDDEHAIMVAARSGLLAKLRQALEAGDTEELARVQRRINTATASMRARGDEIRASLAATP